ncbi:hypothetical protein NC651_031731 [Populus alba x Populus x berolinensis]|nr:hypothetical protein NC651_031731 [Populus alba x Populus x berolinensis]
MDIHGRCYLGVHHGTSGNDVIRGFWGGGSTSAASTVKAIHSLTGDSQRAIDFADCSSHKLKEVKLVGWAYPPMERMKLSVDGCGKGNPGVAGAVWAVVTGLELAWPMVLRRLILEMDSDNFFPFVELEAELRKK